MNYPKTKRTLMSLAVAGTFTAVVVPSHAQEAGASAGATSAGGSSTVVVTGIRRSLQSSMNLKRNSDGIVDGIVAEDIGKFPDTNLAESLQRITGVSIDRTASGEGSKITVRGVGPDWNLVLLNGRQMPGSTLTNNAGDSNGRSFDFANLASEAISQLQVYKSARADTPTGGIGATVNVMTARPLSNPGFKASVGIKGVYDESNNNLPADVREGRNALTPEYSAIYSDTFNDKMFGIGISASYQERNSGFNQAAVSNGWRGPFRGDENNWGTIPQPGTPGSENITNRPDPTDQYQVPQNLNYNFNGISRKRTNGQVVFQFAPTKDITTTLDYTYSQNKVQTRRQDLSAWFNFGQSSSTWTDGPVAAPLVYTEIINPATSDIAMGGAKFAVKNENKSLGFNGTWKVTDKLKVELDTHKSSAQSSPDSPYGSSNVLGTASFSRGTTTADFRKDFPVLSIQGANFAGAPQQVTGSVFQHGLQRSEVDQTQIKASLKLLEASTLNFGVAATKVDNRSAFSTQQRDTWGGATTGADYASSLWHRESVRKYFDNIEGSDNPNLFNEFYTFNFEEVRARAAQATGLPALYMPKSTYDTDLRTTEKSKSAYVQFNTDWDTALPIHTGIGARFEKTDVVSSALVPTATGITWVANNELPVSFGPAAFTTLTGKYDYVLPTADFDIDLTPDSKLRASYGESLGRPRWNEIQGGQVLETLARVDGGRGSQGNPNLKPLKAKNMDLSYEWYYGKQNFFSVGVFKKKLSDFPGQSQITATPFNLRTPIGGTYWNEALANGCGTGDVTCIRNYIFRNHEGDAGVARGPDDANGNATGVISALPTDPIANFRIDTVSNQKNANLSGIEVNVQHMFGNSGFGIAANVTHVKSNISYANYSIGEQFAVPGLSDSANLTGIYEDAKWSIRAAYNWRDNFLSNRFDGSGPNPNYTEAYGQLDLSVGYNVTDKLTIQFEGINLNDGYQRIHGRNQAQALFVTQTGRRYMLGARYKF
jgi:TonB-dependent receptor